MQERKAAPINLQLAWVIGLLRIDRLTYQSKSAPSKVPEQGLVMVQGKYIVLSTSMDLKAVINSYPLVSKKSCSELSMMYLSNLNYCFHDV